MGNYQRTSFCNFLFINYLIFWHGFRNVLVRECKTPIQMTTMNQHKLTTALILILGFFCPVADFFGQPLKVNIKVNSTVGIQQAQPFEIIPEQKSVSGKRDLSSRTRIVNAMGAFTITGKENSSVLVRVNAPEALSNETKQAKPFNMSLAWHNNTACDASKLRFNNNNSNVFEFGKGVYGAGERTMQDDDRQAYLYLKGTAEVPANSQGPLVAEIHLTIEY
jgi:hypothetical protein